jgi:uncharacterized protein YcbX
MEFIWSGAAYFLASIVISRLTTRKSKITVSELWIYPIKSCGGIKIQTTKLSSTGFQFDRMFVIVDEENNFVTQRKYPQMTRIQPSVNAAENRLTISAPRQPDLVIPLVCIPDSNNWEEVRVWSDKVLASIAHNQQANEWVSAALGVPKLRLMRIKSSPDARTTVSDESEEFPVSFVDKYQILLASTGSLDALNDRLKNTPVQVSMLNFRPNIVVRGNRSFEEDTWKDLSINGNMRCKCMEPCSRCTSKASFLY